MHQLCNGEFGTFLPSLSASFWSSSLAQCSCLMSSKTQVHPLPQLIDTDELIHPIFPLYLLVQHTPTAFKSLALLQ